MPKSAAIHPNKEQSPINPQIEKLLTEQTYVILQAVDEKRSGQDKRIEEGFAAQDKRMEERFIAQEIRILAAVDKRLAKTEERFAKSLDELTKTIDKFLKRLSDIEEEFTFMKEDLKRVKAVLREKLGVSRLGGPLIQRHAEFLAQDGFDSFQIFFHEGEFLLDVGKPLQELRCAEKSFARAEGSVGKTASGEFCEKST